jgi:hypothetical protein
MAKKPKFEERRHKPRAPINEEVLIRVGGQSIWGNSVNLSASGVAVICAVRADIGAQVTVSIALPDQLESLQLSAQVANVFPVDGGYQWGLKFINPNYRLIGQIEQFVREYMVTQAREKYQSLPKQRVLYKKKEEPAAGFTGRWKSLFGMGKGKEKDKGGKKK